MKSKDYIFKLTFSGVCLALAILLPYLTGQIPKLGQALSPMHIPAFLCGFICGPVWGAAVGFISPLLRSVITGGMPPLMPTALAMAFELAVYGAASGILNKLLPKKLPYIYVSLISSMLLGRLVGGLVKFALLGFNTEKFTLAIFFADYFTGTLPGIILHILIIPPIIIALRKARLIKSEKEPA